MTVIQRYTNVDATPWHFIEMNALYEHDLTVETRLQHYENMPIQIHGNVYHQKNRKISD